VLRDPRNDLGKLEAEANAHVKFLFGTYGALGSRTSVAAVLAALQSASEGLLTHVAAQEAFKAARELAVRIFNDKMRPPSST